MVHSCCEREQQREQTLWRLNVNSIFSFWVNVQIHCRYRCFQIVLWQEKAKKYIFDWRFSVDHSARNRLWSTLHTRHISKVGHKKSDCCVSPSLQTLYNFHCHCVRYTNATNHPNRKYNKSNITMETTSHFRFSVQAILLRAHPILILVAWPFCFRRQADVDGDDAVSSHPFCIPLFLSSWQFAWAAPDFLVLTTLV